MRSILRRPLGIALILVVLLIAIIAFGYSRQAFGDKPTAEITPAALVKQFEGFSHVPYKDADGYSIGYGHFIKPGEDLKYVTVEEGEALLAKDLKIYESAVDEAVTVEVTSNQRAALVSLCYNIGTVAFKDSTLVRKLNAKDYDGARKQFARWNKSKGKVLQALVKRRAKEAELFGL